MEIKIKDKAKFLRENYPFTDLPALTDLKECIHCGEIITVGDYKVYKMDPHSDMKFICCPNAPECNGTVIDWIDLKKRN